MRVTFVMTAIDLTGGNRVISIYADRLHRLGHDVHVVTRPRRRYSLREKARAWFRGKTIPRNIAYRPSHFDNLQGVKIHKIESHRPIVAADLPDADVVIATWWETAEWVAKLPSSKGAKAYFIQHYEADAGQDPVRVDATWRLPLHKIIIAQWLVDMARDRFGDADVALVPNAVDTEQFNAPPRGRQDIPTVGMMYSGSRFKGCDVTLKAIELAKQQVPNLRLVAFGHHPVHPEMPVPADTDYTVQPAQEKIKEIYARCDAWLVGSRSEGFGLPILEAMACRTPVIATNTGAAPELTAPGGGVLVPVEDPRTMAAEIVRLAKLPEDQWRKMSGIAHTTATRYTWDDATKLFEAALTSATHKSTPAAPH